MTLYEETDDIGLRLSLTGKRLTPAESRAIETIRTTARLIIGSDGITIHAQGDRHNQDLEPDHRQSALVSGLIISAPKDGL